MIREFGKFSRYFTQQGVADMVSKMPKPTTPMMDLLFPAGRRVQKASPFVSVEDITDATGAVPLVRRDGRSVPLDGGKKTRKLIEVDPIKVSRFAPAKDVNDMIALGDTASVQAYVSEQTEYMRDRVSETCETLTRQAMSGKISYPYSTIDGQGGTCEIDLGSPHQLQAASIKGGNIGTIQKWLEDALTKYQQKAGSVGTPAFLLGESVYFALVSIIVSMNQNAPVVWTPEGMTLFGKYKIHTLATTYTLPGETAVNKIVADNELRIVDLSNAGKAIYAALDDLDANLAPLPFYVKPIKTDDPDGAKLIGQSKFIPAIAMSRQAKQTVAV